jgi:putative peptidoglycan lipid II flippase
VLTRALGLLRDQVLTARFGLGHELDAYILALSIPDLLFTLMSGGALSSAFIPTFVQLRRSGDERAAWRMASGVLVAVAMGVTALTVLAWLLTPLLVRDGLARDAAPQTQELAVRLLRIVLLQPLFLSLATVATAILQSFDRFALPAFAPAAYNACIILGALLLSPAIGIYGVALGVVAGGVLFLLVELPSVVRLGLTIPRRWPLSEPHVRSTFAVMLPRIIGQVAVQVNILIALYLAAGLGNDRVSAFRLAYTLFLLPVGLFGISVSTVAFPTLSRHAGAQDLDSFLRVLRRAMRGMLFFVLPASAGLIMLREPIISLIYERGEFGHADTLLTAQPLLYSCFGMWAYALVDVLPRAFYALHDTRTPVRIAVGVVVLDLGLSLLLVRPMGLGGLALALALATMVHVALLMYALRRKVGALVNGATARFVVKALAATLLMLGALWLARPLVEGYESMRLAAKAVRVGMAVASGGAVYLLASIALGQEEVATLLRIARR